MKRFLPIALFVTLSGSAWGQTINSNGPALSAIPDATSNDIWSPTKIIDQPSSPDVAPCRFIFHPSETCTLETSSGEMSGSTAITHSHRRAMQDELSHCNEIYKWWPLICVDGDPGFIPEVTPPSSDTPLMIKNGPLSSSFMLQTPCCISFQHKSRNHNDGPR